jgi:hypothetical protein
MLGSSMHSWLLWGSFLIAAIIISAPVLNAQNAVVVYFGNIGCTPFHVPYQGIADIPVWITTPCLGGGLVELYATNQFISERLGGHFYYDTVYQFLPPEYSEYGSSQTLTFGSISGQDIPFHLADFTVRMDVDSSYIYDVVDALTPGILLFVDCVGYGLLPSTECVSQLAIDDVTGVSESNNMPAAFALHPAYPNPFNASTTISFDIVIGSDVRLSIYDIAGRMVRSFDLRNLAPGENSVVWDGTDANDVPVTSGTYFYRIECGDKTATARVMLLK